MTLSEKKKLLKGRRIVEIRWNAFRRGGGREPGWTSDPVFILDDGTKVSFSVEETEVGEYGISVNVYQKALTNSSSSQHLL
jgi:adenosylcobinamide amidohydrolase